MLAVAVALVVADVDAAVRRRWLLLLLLLLLLQRRRQPTVGRAASTIDLVGLYGWCFGSGLGSGDVKSIGIGSIEETVGQSVSIKSSPKRTLNAYVALGHVLL